MIDPVTGEPNVGSFRGALARVDYAALGASRAFRFAHHKRWVYAAVATDEIFVATAIVDLGYACNAFAFVLHKETKALLVDCSAVVPGFAGAVSDTSGPGLSATFRSLGIDASILRGSDDDGYELRFKARGLFIDARLDARTLSPPISAIATLGDGLVSATEKRTLLSAAGSVDVGGRRFSLDGAVAGFDYTNGLLARNTTWNWAFLMGRAKSGERVALNLVQGFVGEPECGVWVDEEIHPVSEGRFAFDRSDAMKPWRVTSRAGEVELEFEPMGVHRDASNLGLVRSRFVQPSGVFRGTITVAGRRLELDAQLGVVEDQSVVW